MKANDNKCNLILSFTEEDAAIQIVKNKVFQCKETSRNTYWL